MLVEFFQCCSNFRTDFVFVALGMNKRSSFAESLDEAQKPLSFLDALCGSIDASKICGEIDRDPIAELDEIRLSAS